MLECILYPLDEADAPLCHSYGNVLVVFDKHEERRVRLKIDLYVIPTVFLLYLFCFIDRANIGTTYY